MPCSAAGNLLGCCAGKAQSLFYSKQFDPKVDTKLSMQRPQITTHTQIDFIPAALILRLGVTAESRLTAGCSPDNSPNENQNQRLPSSAAAPRAATAGGGGTPFCADQADLKNRILSNSFAWGRNLVIWLMALTIMWLTVTLHFNASAQSASPLIISKDAGGTITRVTMSLGLRSNTACDQTQDLFPDESRFESDDFALKVDDKGVGTFYGTVRLIAPNGQLIQVGTLRGTVGLNTRRDPNLQCRAPWQMEGIFETVPAFAAADRPLLILANFTAGITPEDAGSLLLHHARLDGVVAAPVKVSVAPDKSNYNQKEVVTAVISNHLDTPIVSFDMRSYCTMVYLQKLENDRWLNTAACLLRRAPFPTTIKPSETIQVALAPSDDTPGPNAAGVYRLNFLFSIGTLDGEKLAVTSQTFRVNSMTVRRKVSASVKGEKVRWNSDASSAFQHFN